MPKSYKRANGTGGVTKLSGRRRLPYYARITCGWNSDGKQQYINLGCYKTRAEAINALEMYNARPYNTKNANITFSELYALTKKDQLKTLSRSLAVHLESVYKRLPEFHNCIYREIDLSALQTAIFQFTPAIQKFAVNLLFNMSKEAALLDIPAKDYSKLIKIEKTVQKKERNVFTESEINTIWANSDNYYCKLLLVYLYTGMRLNELLSLKKENVNFAEWIIKGGNKTAAGKNRIIPVHTKIRPILKELFDNGNEGTVCAKSKNTTVIGLYKTLKDLGFNHVVHETRHTFRSRLDDLGIKPVIINLILGHSNGNIGEDIYTHKTIDQLRNAIEKIQ